jgi:CBS domain-containing protein
MTIDKILQGRDGTIFSCNVNVNVRSAVSMLAEKRIGALPIIDGEEVVGIFSERDVLYGLNAKGPEMLDGPVKEAMTASPITVTRDTTVLAALSLMTRRRIRHLPVVEGTKLVGFVSIGDLVKYRIDMIEDEAAALRNYIQTA